MLKPLKFNDEMLKAVLDGRKTQTRRPVEGFSVFELVEPGFWRIHGPNPRSIDELDDDDQVIGTTPEGAEIKVIVKEKYLDLHCPYTKGEHSINARDKYGVPIVGLFVRVRVERLQDISQEDAQAEGMELTGWRPTYSDPDSGGEYETPYDNFAELWISIYGEESWQANPWVWVIEFERMEAK
ncbi:morphogenetic protein [Yersinia enterocolitica]